MRRLSTVSVEERFWMRVNKDGPTPANHPELGPCWVWTGEKHAMGYGTLWLSGVGRSRVRVLSHRLSYEINIGPVPPKTQIDHRCNNRKCVNPTHLRLATNAQNSRNRGKTPGRLKGTTFSKQHQKWIAQIMLDYKHIHIGIYDTQEEAHAAYCAAATKYHGEFANFGEIKAPILDSEESIVL